MSDRNNDDSITYDVFVMDADGTDVVEIGQQGTAVGWITIP